jgi:hypothetical protein
MLFTRKLVVSQAFPLNKLLHRHLELTGLTRRIIRSEYHRYCPNYKGVIE